MAKERVFKVVIDGEEYVSAAAKKAGDGMDDFAKKEPRWIKSFTDLKMAWDAITGAVQRVWGAVQSSFDTFDAYENSLRKMEAQSKLTGVPLSELTAMAEKGRKEFGLGRIVANEYATTVSVYASAAGNAAMKSELYAKALQLGAAVGLDAVQVSEALQQGLRGEDSGFDKLLKKNPSTIWKEYADAQGIAVGKMTDTQKRLAEVTALIEAGEKVGDNYAKMLSTAAGQQTLLNNRLEDAKIAVGGALQPLRILAIQVLGDVADNTTAASGTLNGLARSLASIGETIRPIMGPLMWLADFMLTGLATAFRFAQLDINRAVLKMQERLYSFIETAGSVITRAGDLLSVFGVKVVQDSGDKITAWAKEMSERTGNELLHLGVKMQDFRAEMAIAGERLFGHMSGIAKANLGVIDDAVENTLGRNLPEASAKAGKAVRDNLGPTLADSINLTTDALDHMRITASNTLEPTKAKQFEAEMGKLVTRSHEVRDRIMGWTPSVEGATDKAKDLSREVGTLARAGLDTAQAFGVIDQQAASVLNSVTNIATALPKALAGDLTSMAGILGGVANIASQIIGGDRERRQLLRDNTRGLDRLRSEIGNLRLNVTGEMFTKVQGVLEQVVPGLRGGIQNFGSDMASIFAGLRGAGLTMADLEMVGKELGINLRDSKGNFSIDAVRQLLTAMGLTEFGQFGSGFEDQLDATTRGFDVNQTDDMGQLSALFGVGGRFSPALRNVFDANDLAGSRARLGELFQGLLDGTIDPSQFGGLTGSQFLDFITDAIGRIDGILGADAPAPTGSAPLPGGEDVPTGSSPTPSPTLTLADVFREYRDASIPLLTQQLDLQTRIAAATEATAENTGLTAMEVRALREALLSGTFIDSVDRALADRRREAELTNGAGIIL
jgi:hypothetical protein